MKLERWLRARPCRILRMMDFTVCVMQSHYKILCRRVTRSDFVLKGSLLLVCRTRLYRWKTGYKVTSENSVEVVQVRDGGGVGNEGWEMRIER